MTFADYESHLKRLAAPFSHTKKCSKRVAFKNVDKLLSFEAHDTREASFFSAENFFAWDR